MGKKIFNTIAFSLLLSTLGVTTTACNAGKVKVTFVSENNSDIVRYIKKGKTLVEIPEVPSVKGKYCVWDREDFKNIKEDLTVNAVCYSTVTKLDTNLPSEINVDVFSKEAELDYILKDIEMEVTFESGEKKKIYRDELAIDLNGYNKDVSGTYVLGIGYNNLKKDVKINVNKISNYLTVSLDNGKGYFNEGLPDLIANTDVEGSIAFDSGQTLYIGTNNYAWTFTPVDTNKYATIKGSIAVNLVNANSISVNKETISVAFGSSKEEIINTIKDGLIVKGTYGNTYKEIDSKFYFIDSEDFVMNRSGSFVFKVSYDSSVYTTITVNVEKCITYKLNVYQVDNFTVKAGETLDDAASLVTFSSDVDGIISFKEGQSLGIGNYEYTYVFTPSNSHYAIKEGKVFVHSYKASNLRYVASKEFVYGSTREEIINTLKNSINGIIEYNDNKTAVIDSTKVRIDLDLDYNKLQPDTYKITVIYNDEISIEDTILLKKRVLVKGVDYEIKCNSVDVNNYKAMPYCYIEKLDTTEYDFDPSLFTLIQLSDKDEDIVISNQKYTYKAELVPNDSISDVFESVEVEVVAEE